MTYTRFHSVEYLPALEVPDTEFPNCLTAGCVLAHDPSGNADPPNPALDPVSRVREFKVCAVRLEKVAATEAARKLLVASILQWEMAKMSG